MSEDLIPADIREFIAASIDTIAQLEALLLLRREAETRWTPAMVATRLYISAEDAQEVLNRLCTEALVSCPDGIYQFNPQPPERRELVDRLAEFYSRHLIPVTDLVHTKPPRIRAFADAFKLRKDK